MKKEFITPVIETEKLTARDRVMSVLGASGESDTTDYTPMKDVRPGETDHWYGFNR